MIKSQDIRRFIADKLRNAEFNVISSEIQEGYPKPAVFIYVYPSSITKSGGFLEDDVYSVTIKYIPKTETAQECAEAAEKIRETLMYSTIDVQDRHLTMETMDMTIEEERLTVMYDVPITQSIDECDDYDNAETIEMPRRFPPRSSGPSAPYFRTMKSKPPKCLQQGLHL